MKKSNGRQSRIHEPVSPGVKKEKPARYRNGQHKTAYKIAAAAALILLLVIPPCSYRYCRSGHDERRNTYRWIESGMRFSAIKKKPAVMIKRYKDRKNQQSEKSSAVTPEMNEPKKIEKDKPIEKKGPPDFGTKIELVIPPEKN